MIRVITPNRVLREVVRGYPVCEKRIQFNGWYRRWAEAVNDSNVKPTAIVLEFGKIPGDRFANNQLFVGNLKPEMVRQILQKLLIDEYFDFSQMKYQEKVEETTDTVFDEGESLPYASDFVECSYDLALGVKSETVRPDACNTWQSPPLTAGANCFECGENAESDDDPFSECRNVADEVGDIFRNESIQTGCNDIFARNEGEAF